MSQPAMKSSATLDDSSAGEWAARLEPAPLESQAERRRAQLVRTTAKLIEVEGLDAVRMGRVAELAGCTRALVHQYFARREQLLRAVVYEFTQAIEQRLALAERLVPKGEAVAVEQLAPWAVEVSTAMWEVIEDGGQAGILLLNGTHASRSLDEYVESLRRPVVERWMGHIADAIPSEADRETIVELAIATAQRLALKRQAGELSPEQAIERFLQTCAALFRGFMED